MLEVLIYISNEILCDIFPKKLNLLLFLLWNIQSVKNEGLELLGMEKIDVSNWKSVNPTPLEKGFQDTVIVCPVRDKGTKLIRG
ncbi:hypothetical protein CDL12_26430 [Handroanthus impetiginosus]|uniref:Uncharacterized protein n=1 Tax=Handroanthus impetiginosus TaxID=429701 RepID=A0A2G9G6X9_9LAMI|nr:hypothetical protein CDL12_26430 [Handroanthus impetiginosus]